MSHGVPIHIQHLYFDGKELTDANLSVKEWCGAFKGNVSLLVLKVEGDECTFLESQQNIYSLPVSYMTTTCHSTEDISMVPAASLKQHVKMHSAPYLPLASFQESVWCAFVQHKNFRLDVIRTG